MEPLSIFFLSVGLLAFANLAWYRLSYAAAAVLFLLPTYLLRFRIGFVPTTVLELLLLVVIVAFVLRLARRKIPHARFPRRLPIFLFLLAGAVAVLLSPDIRHALGMFRAYLLEPVLFAVVLMNTIRTPGDRRLALLALGAAVVAIGYVALLQSLSLVPIPAHYGLESPPRATSVFPFPTAVGKFVGPLVALFLALLLIRDPARLPNPADRFHRKAFPFGVVLFGLLALVLSVSRGALLGVAAGAVLISLFSRFRKKIFLTLVLIVILAFLLPQTRDNIVGVFTARDTSTDVRLVLWQGARRIVADHPVSGTGLASFPIVYDRYRDPAHVELFPNPDNLILTLWIEMGLAGLLTFIVLLGFMVAAAIRGLTQDRPLAVGLLAAFAAFLVHGLVDTPYFKNDLAVVFWALFALSESFPTAAPRQMVPGAAQPPAASHATP